MITVQPSLFDPPPPPRGVPYQRKSATSRAAAERVRPIAPNHESLVYDAIVAAGVHGITRKELAATLFDRQQQKVCGRVASLIEKGVVRETDERRDGSKVLIAASVRP